MNNNALVIYENRKENEIAVKLLIESVINFCDPIDIHLFYPESNIAFKNWCEGKDVHLHQNSRTNLSGWNAKPEILLWGLERGYSRVVFLDSDIILSRKWPHFLIESEPKTLVLAQLSRSSRKHTQQYVRAWNFKKGRSFLRGVSGCAMSASKHHTTFLLEWQAMLQQPKYKKWQERPYNERPLYAVGSDAILTALVGSAKYKYLKIKFIKNGVDIAQCLSPSYFAWDHRLMTLVRGNPPLIHAMGPKPWLIHHENYISSLSISPYSCAARNLYSTDIGKFPKWLNTPTEFQIQYNFFNDHISLTSLPNSLCDHIRKAKIKTLLKTISHLFKTIFNHH